MRIAIDYDGTLIRNRKPYQPTVEVIKQLLAKKVRVVIYTARLGEQVKVAQRRVHNLGFKKVKVIGGKFRAEWFVDDRALTIPELMHRIETNRLRWKCPK